MPPEVRKYLEDVQQACELLLKFTSGKSITDYEGDPMLRSAVERQFEIIGEAVSGLARINPAIADRISYHERIIALRNILIHGYADVDNRLVWDVLRTNLPTLRGEINTLLAE